MKTPIVTLILDMTSSSTSLEKPKPSTSLPLETIVLEKLKRGTSIQSQIKPGNSVRTFFNDVGCLGSSTTFSKAVCNDIRSSAPFPTSSKAVCNDIRSSAPFVVLSGVKSLSLGKLGCSLEQEREVCKDQSSCVCFKSSTDEARSRWIDRMETCMSVGNVIFKKRYSDHIERFKFELENEESETLKTTQIDEGNLGQHRKGDDMEERRRFFSQSLVTRTIPRNGSWKDSEWNVNFDVREKLAPRYIKAIYHLMEHDFDRAVDRFDEILVADQRIYGTSNLIVGVSMHNLAVVNYLAGNGTKALKLLEKAVAIKKKSLRSSDASIVASQVEIGNLLYNQCKFNDALIIYEEALKAFKIDSRNEYTQNHFSLMSAIYNNAGCVHVQLGNYESGLKYLNEALVHQRMELGSDPNADNALLNHSVILVNMGYVHMSEKNSHEALPFFEDALLVQESILKVESSTVEITKHNLNFCQKSL